MRKLLAIWIAKALIFVSKMAGKKGSSAPGTIALKICPNILKILSKQVKNDIIVVCGTNGKTTTNNLIYSLLNSCGKKVVCNNVGANMLPGVVTAFINSASVFGKLDADYACLEIDELFTAKVFPHLKPDYFVLTNLFRDQMDRYGDIDVTVECIKSAVEMASDAILVLNGDDPVVSAFGKSLDNKCKFFGVSEDAGVELNEPKDGRFCPFCGEEIKYNFYHYSQLGDFYCSNCDFKRPDIDYDATNIDVSNGISFDVSDEHISVNYRGFYNIYNILAAYAVLDSVLPKSLDINKALAEYKPQIGRMETYDIGVPVVFNLAKNPAGFNQAISTVLSDKRKKSIILAVNDNESDGRDVSWLWDVDFERLADANVSKIYCTGLRRNELCVRFKYAGFVNFSDIDEMKTAILTAKDNADEVIYLLVNYTALFSTENILKDLSQENKK